MGVCFGQCSNGDTKEEQERSEDKDVLYPADALLGLLVDVTDVILSYLSEADLCRLAQCSRGWRERTNRDWLWRPSCLARGWERYGTVVDLNPDKGFLDHSHVLTAKNAQTLEPTCYWKAVFLKAMVLEINWAQAHSHMINCPVKSADVESIECDGDFAVKADTRRIQIWNLKLAKAAKVLAFKHQAASCSDHSYCQRVLVSCGIGLTIGCYEHPTRYFVRTFDCKTAAWLASFEYESRPVQESYRLHGKTLIGQPSETGDLREFSVWSSIAGTLRHILSGHETHIKDLALCGNMAASVAENVKLWDVNKGECLRNFECQHLDGNRQSKCQLNSRHFALLLSKERESESLTLWNIGSGDCSTVSTIPIGDDLDYDFACVRLALSEFAVVRSCRLHYYVWNDKLQVMFESQSAGRLLLAGARMIRYDRYPRKRFIYRLGPGTKSLDLLRKTALYRFLCVIWADDTKLIMFLSSPFVHLDPSSEALQVLHFW